MADVSTVEVSGPLGPFAAGFVADLSRQGFSPVALRKHVGLLAGLSGWLAAEGMNPSGLSSEVAERFCVERRAAGHTYLLTAEALGPLLGYLRGLGVAPPPSPLACAGPVEELLSRFRRYLEQERGLVPAAARGYVDKVRPFVARFEGPTGLELWRVDVAEVRGFVVDVCPRPGRRSAQLTNGGRAAVASAVLASRRRARAVAGRRGAVGLRAAVVGVAEAARGRPGRRAACVVRHLVGHRHPGPGDLDGAGTTGAARCGGRRPVAGGRRLAGGRAGRAWQGWTLGAAAAAARCRGGDRRVSASRSARERAGQGGVRACSRAAPSTVAGRGHLRCRGGRAQSRARADPCASAAAHRGVGNAPGRRDAAGGRAGAPSPPREEHRDLCEMRREALCCIPGAAGRNSKGCSWVKWLTQIRKVKGTAACQESDSHAQVSEVRCRETRVIWRKLDCLKPNLQKMQDPSAGKTLDTGATLCDGILRVPLQPSGCGALPSEGNQGDESCATRRLAVSPVQPGGT